MYKIIDKTIVKIEQFETVTEVTSQRSIKEQIDALKGSQESVSLQIDVLNLELAEVEKLEFEIINNLKNESISKIIK
jgi:hypothetical protein